MNELQELEQKIRQAIPELKDEFEAFEDGSIDRDMITQIGLNYVLMYLGIIDAPVKIRKSTNPESLLFQSLLVANYKIWNLKSPYLKAQSPELINFLNELK
jgi:hypothetical protein